MQLPLELNREMASQGATGLDFVAQNPC
jgi:hypothetical protein